MKKTISLWRYLCAAILTVTLGVTQVLGANFYLEVKTPVTTANVGSGKTLTLNTTDHLNSLSGGSVVLKNTNSSGYDMIKNQSSKGAICMGSNTHYFILTLNSAIAEGDEITFTSTGSQYICFTKTETRSDAIKVSPNGTNKLTIAKGNALIGASTIYVWRGGGNTYVNSLTITSAGYSITYHCNGAESGCPSDVASGATALPNPLPAAPSKTGYEFTNWYTNEGLTAEAVAGATLSANADLYAGWTVNSHTLTWNIPNDATITNPETYTHGTVAYGTAIVAPTLSRTGYDFLGWNTDVAATMPDNDLEYTAQWQAEAQKFDITFAKGVNTSATVPANVNASNVTLAALTTDNNFRFDGWKANQDVHENTLSGTTIPAGTLIEADTKVFVTAATMFTAQWTPKYAVTFNSDGGSAVATQYIISGENASEPADPTKDGYVFQGWQLAGADYDFATAVTAAITLDANWKQLFTVSYYDGETKLGEEDVVDGESPAHSGDYETKAEHYTFDAWKNKAADIINVATLVVTKDTALYGYWTEDPKAVVTFRVDEAQYGEIQNVYLGGKVAPVDAPSKAGYVFNGWYNGESKFDFTATIAAAGTITLDAKWEEGDANHYIYAYNDATRYDGSAYHTPEGKVATSGDNKNLTTPYTLFSGTAGITSIVAKKALYDGKGTYMNAYMKLKKDDATSNIAFTIASGYTAVLKMKMGGYSSNPTATLKKGDDAVEPASGEISGKATTENDYAEITYNLSAGTYTLTASSQNMYISHINLEAVSIPTSLDNTEASVKAVKRLENGIVIIEKAGKTYNVMGQAIK